VSEPRRILMVEDSADDSEVTARAIRAGGCDLTYDRVDTPETMREALRLGGWDLVIADYSMPRFHGLTALKMLRDSGLDIPFILVSGAVGEDLAVDAMRSGADDYVLKSNMTRLSAAVDRELREYEGRHARKRAESLYRSLVERLPVGLFRSSTAGELLEVNPAMIEMLGFSDANALKQFNNADLWVDPTERDRLLDILRRKGIVKNFAMHLRRTDGTLFWGEQSVHAVYNASGGVEYYEGVLIDINNRKIAEEEANSARDRVRDLALETARVRSEFLASMSHEIRTPLVGIIGTGELLSHSDLNPTQRRQTEMIRSSGDLLLTIVNDILDFSKLAAGRLELERIDFDLVDLMENLVDSFALATSAKGIELCLFVDANVPAGLRGDQSRLRQVLNNLVSNAIKFTERGEVTVNATKLRDSDGGVLVRFEIVDTGMGIPLEVQPRLFQPFVQAEGSTSRRFGGTGLGLVIAAKLIDQMDGEIGFESMPGKGSNFHFTARFEKGAEAIHPWMTATAASCLSTILAIIVNDSPARTRVVGQYLSKWGVENEAVESGADVLEMLKRKSVTHKQIVVLIDQEAPAISAIRLARAIKDGVDGKNHKVIVFSLPSGVTKSIREIDAWISKPTRPSHLFSCLLELCGSSARPANKTFDAVPGVPTTNRPPLWRKSVRVLLVDDNLVNRTVGAQQLSNLGYLNKVADSARHGLEIVADLGTDIVLMDCEMPGMDGYEAVARIRKSEGTARHTVVIALTAHASEEDRARCIDAGMDDYLSKPVRLETLAEMLDRWVRNKLDHVLPAELQTTR